MFRPRPIMGIFTLIFLIAAFCGTVSAVLAQDFKPNAVIEYKVRGAFPEQWERGVIVRALEGGKQYLIREKPSQFFPEGSQSAYYPTDLRVPQAPGARNPAVKPPASPPATPPQVPGPPPILANVPLVAGQGLLGKEEIFAEAQRRFGPGDPFADGRRRDALLESIRDLIKARGTNFLPDAEFQNRMSAIGAYSVHIGSAIEANFGATPKKEDYFGEWLLRSANRGTKSVAREGSRVIITTSDAQFESGSLTINKDGTFIWKISRSDPESQWVKGRWREVKPEELNPWEAGPALWLEKARQNEDYMARMCRVPGYLDWLDVGMGTGRIAIQYGRRPEGFSPGAR